MKRKWRLGIGLLVAAVVVGPYAIPIPALKDVSSPEDLADPDSRFAEVDDLKVHYKVAGQGELALLLLHGFGASVWSWRQVWPSLAEHGLVAGFDRPAFGLTERPLPGEWRGANPYGLQAQVRLTIGMLDELGIQRGILVGHSAGGMIAMLTALEFPARVRALVLVSPSLHGGGMASWVRPLLHIPQVRRLGPLAVRALVGRLEQALPSAWHDPAKVTAEVLAGYKRPLHVENWDIAFWEYLAAGDDVDVLGRLDHIGMPTLVVTGDDDTWVPTSQSVQLAGRLPDAKLVVIPNCGHVAMDECPAEFLQAVVPFLDSLP